MKWTDFVSSKKETLPVLLLIGILLLVLAVPSGTSSDFTQTVEQTKQEAQAEYRPQNQAQEWIEYHERKLQQALSAVSGVGNTKVLITVKSDGQSLIEKDVEEEELLSAAEDSANETQKKRSESTVYEKKNSGTEQPFVTETLLPEISGVLIIAQGGGDAKIQNEITEAAMALFGVDAHKIKVMKME